MNLNDVKEVDGLRDNVLWLKDRMAAALGNWRTVDPRCEYNAGLIKDICQRPGTLYSEIFDPLIKWLSDYIIVREKNSLQGKDLDAFLIAGLYRIFRFITVAEFFSQNSSLFHPTPSPMNRDVYRVAIKTQKDYQEFIDLLMGKLIGCSQKLSFIFLNLIGTVNNLPSDLVQMKSYLENECLFIRRRALTRR